MLEAACVKMLRQFSAIIKSFYLLLSISQGQVSSSQPVLAISVQYARTVIAVLSVVGLLILCAIAGVFVYCICQPRSRQVTVVSNSVLSGVDTYYN